jgi:hypothetical protein
MAKKKPNMVTLRCDATPTLLITTPHAQFEDGLATVPAADAELILDVLGDDYGITSTDGTPQSEPTADDAATAEDTPTD